MTPSPWLYDFLKRRLPFRPTAYRAHRGDPWTIGYGHTGALTGSVILAGATISTAGAEQLLRDDIERAALDVLNNQVEVRQGHLDVLVALAVTGC